MNRTWTPSDIRDEIVAFVAHWSEQTGLAQDRFIAWLGIQRSRFFDWKSRYRTVNQHNAPVPREHWLAEWEQAAICEFARSHPSDGYRRLAFMMLDADVGAVSPSSVYRLLNEKGLLCRWPRVPS